MCTSIIAAACLHKIFSWTTFVPHKSHPKNLPLLPNPSHVFAPQRQPRGHSRHATHPLPIRTLLHFFFFFTDTPVLPPPFPPSPPLPPPPAPHHLLHLLLHLISSSSSFTIHSCPSFPSLPSPPPFPQHYAN